MSIFNTQMLSWHFKCHLDSCLHQHMCFLSQMAALILLHYHQTHSLQHFKNISSSYMNPENSQEVLMRERCMELGGSLPVWSTRTHLSKQMDMALSMSGSIVAASGWFRINTSAWKSGSRWDRSVSSHRAWAKFQFLTARTCTNTHTQSQLIREDKGWISV